MLVIEIELGVIALSILGLVAVLVPVLIRLGRVSEESEHLLRHLNAELPHLFQHADQMIQRIDGVAANVKQVTAEVKTFSEAIAGLGRTITTVSTSIRRQAETLLLDLSKNAHGWIAGARAAYRVIKVGTTSSLPRRDLGDQRITDSKLPPLRALGEAVHGKTLNIAMGATKK
jgi:uncharacterized protein YoxC